MKVEFKSNKRKTLTKFIFLSSSKEPSTQKGNHNLSNYTQSLLKVDQNRKKNLKNKTSEKVLPILSKEVDLRSCLCTNSLP